MGKEYDQLAAVLKSCGIVASQYDAKMMAENITQGVAQNASYYQKLYKEPSVFGRQSSPNPFAGSSLDAQFTGGQNIATVPLEPEKEVFANTEIASSPEEEMTLITPSDGFALLEQPVAAELNSPEEKEVQEIAEDILREKEVGEAPQSPEALGHAPKIDIEIKAASEAPAEAADSNIDMQLMVKQMAEQMLKEKLAEQQAQQKALQEQVLAQQKVIQQMAMQQQAAKEVAPRPEPKPESSPKPQQQFSYPAREERKGSGYFREIPVDKSKPKATLSKEEQKATDITYWFNFSRK